MNEESIVWLPTGIEELDDATGGGLPQGRLVEFLGEDALCVARTVMLSVLKPKPETLRPPGRVVLVDAANCFDPSALGVPAWLKVSFADLGVLKTSTLPFVRLAGQTNIVDALMWVARQLDAGDLLVVNDLFAAAPESVVKGALPLSFLRPSSCSGVLMSHDVPYSWSRAVNQALRVLVPVAHKRGVTLLMITPHRRTIAGRPVSNAGAKFYASLRVEFARGAMSLASCATRAKVIKNKLAAPFQEALFARQED